MTWLRVAHSVMPAKHQRWAQRAEPSQLHGKTETDKADGCKSGLAKCAREDMRADMQHVRSRVSHTHTHACDTLRRAFVHLPSKPRPLHIGCVNMINRDVHAGR